MAKRKRKDAAEVITERKKPEAKKVKVQNTSPQAFKSNQVVKSKAKPSTAVVEAPVVSKPNALRIVVGSYEKVLCGIDARFPEEAVEKVSCSPFHANSEYTRPETRIHVLRTYGRNQMSCLQRPLHGLRRLRRSHKVPSSLPPN